MKETKMGARLGISGALEYRDAVGNVVARVPFHGSVPVADEQAADLMADGVKTAAAEREDHGTDDR